jgi:hypothetical protein
MCESHFKGMKNKEQIKVGSFVRYNRDELGHVLSAIGLKARGVVIRKDGSQQEHPLVLVRWACGREWWNGIGNLEVVAQP